MQKILTVIATLCLLPVAAQAGAIYEFETTRITGVGLFPEIPFQGISYSLEISDEAFADGGLHIDFTNAGGGIDGDCGNLLRFSAITEAADGTTSLSCADMIQNDNTRLIVDLTLIDGGQSLAGSFFFNDSNSDWILASVSGDLWAGTFVTDASPNDAPGCFDSDVPCAYEGVWRLVSAPTAVPEPGTLALMLVGLGGLLTAPAGKRRGSRG